ncbi:MAG: chromosomal replication initiator protein DnaA [Selenomonadaceae bacterium]|nr:chromosomal replication initiator protein DnaA [Selenomonadaceae bacterium]
MDSSQLKVFWKQILVNMQEVISETACQKWLEPLVPLSLEKNVLSLGSSTDFRRQWIEERYLSYLEEAVYNLTGEHFSIVLKLIQTENKKSSKSKSQNALQTTLSINSADSDVNIDSSSMDTVVSNENPNDSTDIQSPADSSTLISKYTFENFIIGKSNEFAHAAALAVAKSPGKSYNPFFIYGGVGLGKTHLMHAIGNAIIKKAPHKRVLYVSSEQFTNELINALRDYKIGEFKQKYRTIDVLLVDDVQFLAGKDSTQEEFFHTFNSLYNLDKQIVLSSDRHPQSVAGIEERLRSRFDWGLVTDIQKPDLETRIAILQKKAIVDNIDVPYEVIAKIATEIDTNVRDLEGVFTRVIAFASLTNKTFDLSILEESKNSIDPESLKTPTSIEDIERTVAMYFNLSVNELHIKSRAPKVAYPRQIVMYLCRELTSDSFPEIARHFGGLNHTTVIRGYDKIKAKRNKDPKFNELLNTLIEHIKK